VNLRRTITSTWVAAVVLGCGTEADDFYRGRRFPVATLSTEDQVRVYRAALGGPFTMGDPTLRLLLDTLYLPRDDGLAGGRPIPAALISALRTADVIHGTCTVPVTKARSALVCPAERAGYAVRVSEPFAIGADSVQVHVVVEQYAIPGGPQSERLRFERAYYVVRGRGGWRAAREARLPQP
jgi:hypothetical protein